MPEIETYYTTEDLAQRYSVKPETIQRWVRNGRIKALNLGGGHLGPYSFRPNDVDEFERKSEVYNVQPS